MPTRRARCARWSRRCRGCTRCSASITTSAAGLPPLLYSVDQAAAERTPNAAGFLARYNTIALAFRNARETSQLNTVAVQIVALQTAVTAALNADQCGHAVPSGKAITLNLTLQEAVFYDNGCVVRATPITTGRPFLRTPTGVLSCVLQGVAVHDGVTVAARLAVLVSDRDGDLGDGVRCRRLLPARRVVGAPVDVRPGQREQLRGEPWVRAHPDSRDAMGLLSGRRWARR